jgi:hypothetical protein
MCDCNRMLGDGQQRPDAPVPTGCHRDLVERRRLARGIDLAHPQCGQRVDRRDVVMERRRAAIARAVTAPPAPISASETAAVAIGNSPRISAPRLPENQLERNPFCTSQVCATLATVWF